MKFNITDKQFILFSFVVLTVIFFFAFHNLTSDGKTCTLDITMNSTSPHTQLQISGAEITGLERLTEQSRIDYSSRSITYNNSGISDIRVRLKTQDGPIKFTLSKEPTGKASAQISGVGLIENNYEAVNIPIYITTNATFSKIRFDGMTLVGMDNQGIPGLSNLFSYDDHTLTINNTAEYQLESEIITEISFEKETGIITLDKSDDGIFSIDIAGYQYTNTQDGTVTLHNVPLNIEMTANKTQIIFNDGSLLKAKMISADNPIQNSIIGENFIYLNYPGEIDTYHKSEYLLDLNLTPASALTIVKANEGFVNVQLGSKNYFSIDSNPLGTYYSQTYPITELPAQKEEEEILKSTLVIETTSDWTDISLEGLQNPQYTITGYEGYIVEPHITGNTVSIKKKTSEDTSFALVSATVQASGQENPTIIIEKGDIGSTTVIQEDNSVFLNGENIARDARNRVSFEMAPFVSENADNYVIYQNPVSYIFPSAYVLSEKDLTLAETQPQDVSVAVSSSDLPGFTIELKDSVAKGVIAFVFISYALLGILLLSILIQEGFFGFLPEGKFSLKTIWTLLTGTFEQLPISSTFILEALVVLALTPFLLMTNEVMAEGAAVLAYLLLVVGVICRLLEMKEIIILEKSKEMFIKIDSLVILLAAGYIAAFELRKTVIGLFGILGMIGVTIIFLGMVFLYINRNLYES